MDLWFFLTGTQSKDGTSRDFSRAESGRSTGSNSGAFEQFKSKERLVLQLFYLDELNYEEIVEITQMSLANVKVSLHRAKKKMKLLFDQKEIAINT